MRPAAATFLTIAAALQSASASTCSQSEAQMAFGLYRSAASLSGCRPYASYDADGAVTISWSCSTTECAAIMQELAFQLPNCESSDGINRKAQLEDSLYNKCQLCTFDQRDQMTALWKRAAQDSACSQYATAGGTWFSWPCSATRCTATLRDMANKMPTCYIDGQVERTRILNTISTCTGTTVATRTPSPASTSTGASDEPPATDSLPSAPVTDTPSSEADSPAPSDASNDSDPKPPKTLAPSPSSSSSSSYSMSSCINYDARSIVSLYVAAAKSSNCKPYSMVTTFGVLIAAPCTSPCVKSTIRSLANSLPNCYYSYDAENKKKAVDDELAKCKYTSASKRLLLDAEEQNVTLQLTSESAVESNSTAKPTSAPAVSSGSRFLNHTWASTVTAALMPLTVAMLLS